MDMQRLRAIIDALRNPTTPDRVVYKNGKEFRREPVKMTSPLTDLRNDKNYGRYKKVQGDIGEDAVSYEEWMKGQ